MHHGADIAKRKLPEEFRSFFLFFSIADICAVWLLNMKS